MRTRARGRRWRRGLSSWLVAAVRLFDKCAKPPSGDTDAFLRDIHLARVRAVDGSRRISISPAQRRVYNEGKSTSCSPHRLLNAMLSTLESLPTVPAPRGLLDLSADELRAWL